MSAPLKLEMILKHVDRSLWGEVWLRLANCRTANRRLVYRVEQYARIDQYRSNCRYVEIDEEWTRNIPLPVEHRADLPDGFMAAILLELPSDRHRRLAVACLAGEGLQRDFCAQWGVSESRVSKMMRETKAILRDAVERLFPEMVNLR